MRYGFLAKLSLTLEEWFNLLKHKYPICPMIERIGLNFDKYINIKTLFKYFKINQNEIIEIKGFITVVVKGTLVC